MVNNNIDKKFSNRLQHLVKKVDMLSRSIQLKPNSE